METVSKNDRTKTVDYHQSVLLQEAVDFLNVRVGRKYIDCTLGSGGHSAEIIRRGGVVLAIDADWDALDYVRAKNIDKAKLILTKGNFINLKKIAKNNKFEHVDGILYDLGVSTHQLKTKERGFSFGSDDELDMRIDRDLELDAREVVNKKTKKELYEIFAKYGEEKRAWAIADAIIVARDIRPIVTTGELVKIVLGVRGKIGERDRTHPATRVFQAIRIYVNNEIEALKKSLPQASEILDEKGRLVVISFHSLEDRIVKRFFLEEEKRGNFKILTKKPIRPEMAEIETNPAARSGKLRVAEKL